MFESSKCIACHDCLSASKNKEMELKKNKITLNPSSTQNTESFRDICPTKALQIVGEDKSPNEICRIVLKDRVFYKRSGGGVTLSGGEPLMQSELCLEVAKRLKKENIHVSIETCLHVPWKNIEPLLPYIDEFLCDVKHCDPIIFRKQTGGDLNLIVENLDKLSESGAHIRARVPIIYRFNHDENTVEGILDIIEANRGITAVDFMPYHPMGAGKYECLGRAYSLPEHIMADEEISNYIKSTEFRKIPATIGG